MRDESAYTYSQLRRLRSHRSNVTSIAFSGQGNFLATAGLDGKVCVWDIREDKLLRTCHGRTPVLSLVWIPNGEDSIVVGYADGNIATLSLTSNLLNLSGFWAHNHPIEHLAICGPTIATGAQREVRLWEWHPNAPWKLKTVLTDPPENINNKNGDILVTGMHWASWRKRSSVLMVSYMHHGILLYDPTSWKLIHVVTVHGPISCTSMSRDSTYLAICKLAGTVDILDVASEVYQCSLPISSNALEERLVPVSFINGGNAITVRGEHGTVNIWNIDSTSEVTRLLHRRNENIRFIAAYTDTSVDRVLIATAVQGPREQHHVSLWVGRKRRWETTLEKEAGCDDANRISIICSGLLHMFIGAVILFIFLVLTFEG